MSSLSRPPPPRELPDAAIPEILLRIPPDEPESLVHASLVRKAWRSVLSDPTFCRHYRDFHRTPPMLGFLCNDVDSNINISSRFLSTAAFRPRRPRRGWSAISARHNRALFQDTSTRSKGLLLWVWDPVTDWKFRVPELRHRPDGFSAAVLCGKAGCDHRGCRGDPFIVAVVGINDNGVTHACVYTTEAGAWSDTTSIEHGSPDIGMRSSVLVGDSLYFMYEPSTKILRYDLVDRELSVIDRPKACKSNHCYCNIVLVTTEDGALGFAGVHESTFSMWSMNIDAKGAVAWAERRVVELGTVLPPRALRARPLVNGFVEGGGVIILGTMHEIFTFEIKSGRVKKVSNRRTDALYITPYTSFYTLDLANSIMPLTGAHPSNHHRQLGAKSSKILTWFPESQ